MHWHFLIIEINLFGIMPNNWVYDDALVNVGASFTISPAVVLYSTRHYSSYKAGAIMTGNVFIRLHRPDEDV